VRAAGRTWIRYISTALIVVFLAVVAFVGFERTRRNTSNLGAPDPGTVMAGGDDFTVGLYQGLRHTETLGGKLVFVLDSLRTLSLASGWQEIEGVRLQFYHDEGEEGPVLTCERASFNMETRDARLEGGINVEFPNGAFLTTEAGRFESRARRFVSEASVLYVDGGTFGQAEQATYSLAEDRVKLEGNGAFRTDENLMLSAPTIVYLRGERKVLLSEGVRLTQIYTKVAAPRAVVSLAPGDGPPERIDLTGGVVGQTVVESTGGAIEFWGEQVIAERDAQGNWQIDARTSGPWIEVRFIGGPDFYQRTLRTTSLRGVVGPAGILTMQGMKGVCFEEIPFDGPPRIAASDTARAWFDEGQLTDVELDGEVELLAEGVRARGRRARLVQRSGLVMLEGDPTGRERVTLVSDRGRVSCDQANLFDQEGRVEAKGQVNGELEQTRLFGPGGGSDSDGPVRLAAEALDVTDSGNRFLLRDNARIWQGHRLLLADEVEYLHVMETVHARGHVRATFPARQMDPDAPEGEDVIVVSRSLEYDAVAGRAVFRGSVHYSDPEHSLSANRLIVNFDERDKISDVEAEGTVEIIDLASNRRLTGQHAIRTVADQVITVTGSPAQLTDEKGNVASGESLTWNQADGTVSIGGGTELIYYPEEQP
jgi:lipopolysaccharide export system protein LptA